MKSLFKIKDKGIDFKLVVVGESFKNYPNIFNKAKIRNNFINVYYQALISKFYYF